MTDNEEEKLEKGIGRITFPKLDPTLPTRPDQEVVTVSTPRQADIQSLKQQQNITNANINPEYAKATRKKLYDYLRGIISGTNVSDATGSVFSTTYRQGNKNFSTQPVAVQNPGATTYNYFAHHKRQTGPSTAEHEGYHYLIGKIAERFGTTAGDKINRHLVQFIHPEDRKHIHLHLKNLGYEPNENTHEEKIAWLGSLLSNNQKRKEFEGVLNSLGKKPNYDRMKQSWKAIVQAAKELKEIPK